MSRPEAPEPPPAFGPQGEAPPFAAPWQAQAFALVVSLHEQGAFTWPEWTKVFSRRLAHTPNGDPEGYYHAWVAALEDLAADRGLASPGDLAERKHAWADAYRHTPHGKPVRL